MRVASYVGVCLLASVGAVATQSPDERAAAVLGEARAALGGDATLGAVTSLSATGRTRRVQGENLVPIEFEILVEFPDKYLRKDEIPAQESDPSTTGFNGDALIQIPAPTPPAARPGAPAPPPGAFENMLKTRVLNARQDFARLMLGMFATSFDAYPLTFKYVAQAEAPQGKAHVLEGQGDGGFTLRFFVHADTHLPVMVSWTGPARPMPAGRGARGAPPGAGPQAQPAQAAPPSTAAPEHRLYFADYRDVDGLKLPFRIRRALGADTTEETTFDRFHLNPRIDPRRFEVRR